MTFRPLLWILLVSFPIGVGVGQVLLKMAAQQMQVRHSVMEIVTNPLLIAAFSLYATLGVVWLLILKELPLSVAYPFVALSFAVTPLLAWLVLGDKPQGLYFLGIALICAGVAVTQRAIHAS